MLSPSWDRPLISDEGHASVAAVGRPVDHVWIGSLDVERGLGHSAGDHVIREVRGKEPQSIELTLKVVVSGGDRPQHRAQRTEPSHHRSCPGRATL